MNSKTTWGVGEYGLMAEALDPASRIAVDLASIKAGDRVVDVATGTGNAAIWAARCGALVLGVDLEPRLLRIAEQRALKERLEIEWAEGDAQALPVESDLADVVLSVFGSMYAPDQIAAISELVRVVTPTGCIVIAAWTPDGVMPGMGSLLSNYLPTPPAASGPPSNWGRTEFLRTTLRAAGASLKRAHVHNITLKFSNSTEAVEFLIRTAGHVIAQREKLIAAGEWHSLQRDLVEFVELRGTSNDGRFYLRLEFLVAIAARAAV